MRLALRLASRAYGETSPNPLVGAVLSRGNKIIGRGWHRRAGLPHAEIEAMADARRRGFNLRGATLHVTLEPCCSHGRTPPCTDAIRAAGIARVVVGAVDPNPQHAGRGLELLRQAGIEVLAGIEQEKATRLNEAFNHWIVQRTPFVTIKAAMTLDGKIATASGQSKWITGPRSRAHAMHLRQGSDAILVGVNTITADDPQLTIRFERPDRTITLGKPLRRIVLDPSAKLPLSARVLSVPDAPPTTVVVTKAAPARRLAALRKKCNVLVAPMLQGKIDLRWLMKTLGAQNVTSLLVEGGGETNALFLEQGLAHRTAFFYAPKILGGTKARKAVAGSGLSDPLPLRAPEWKKLGDDLFLSALIGDVDHSAPS